jgi:menaquinone-9 beta-reductase
VLALPLPADVEAAMTLAATGDLGTVAATVWDAVVVGAGPAGALAARELARRGRAVLLLDREPFPRWKVCGCCLSARALGMLARVGLADLPGRCGAVALRQVRLAAPGCRAAVPVPEGAALSRQALDAALVEAAVLAGASFLPATRAARVERSPEGRRLLLRRGECQAGVSARLVLLAPGLGGVPPGEPGLRLRTARAARVGAGVIVDEAPAFYGPGTIFMACGGGGYLGLVRLEDGRLDLAAAFDVAWLRRAGGPGRAAAALLDEVGWPAVPGLTDAAWRGTPRLTRRLVSPAAERLFVLGDAAGYVEPFTGEGMAWALASAAALAPLADRAVRGWSAALAGEWCRLYRRTVVRRQAACRVAAELLRHPTLVRAALRLLAAAPGLAAPLVRHLNAPARAERSRPS